jgi:antitoxin component YwqK of YwqJK toxin-antitoxin module
MFWNIKTISQNLLLVFTCVTLQFTAFGQKNQVDAKGKKQGVWEKQYPKSNAFEYKGQFKDDKPIGTFTFYYQSTKVKAVVVHDPKSNRSSSIMYHENGVLMAKGIFRSQLKDSIWSFYGPTGRISYKETYKNGKLHGLKTVYYVPENPEDKTVLVAKTYMYKNDVIDGDVIEYFDTGIIKSKVNYVKGKPLGLLVINHPNGKPMIHERYKYGNRHGWCMAFDETGKETGRKYFKFGQELKGKELENWLQDCKAKGRNPNE